MTCEFCNNPNVVIKIHEGTGEVMLWDTQSERPHNCQVTTIYCPSCRKRMLQVKPCVHYQDLNYTPGENEAFFIRMIKFPPKAKTISKRIGTSAGNNRAKNTRCTFAGCNKDINGYSFDKIQQHVEDHKKEALQERLF